MVLLKRPGNFLCCLLLLLLSSSTSLSAQSSLLSALKFSYSLDGLLQHNPLEGRFYVSLVLPGPSFTVGTKHHWYLNSKRSLSLGLGMLYSHSAFSRVKIEKLGNGGKSKRKQQYRKQYILVPFDINYHYKKFSFSAGFVYTSTLSINMKLKNCQASSASEACRFKQHYEVDFQINERGEDPGVVFATSKEVFIDGRSNLQYLGGVYYQLRDRLTLGIEYRDFIFKDFLNVIDIRSDLISHSRYDHQTSTIDLSILYALK